MGKMKERFALCSCQHTEGSHDEATRKCYGEIYLHEGVWTPCWCEHYNREEN
jgi:hypothetical protein